eukprot:jgi/Chlat1/9002/Chrsp94S08285
MNPVVRAMLVSNGGPATQAVNEGMKVWRPSSDEDQIHLAGASSSRLHFSELAAADLTYLLRRRLVVHTRHALHLYTAAELSPAAHSCQSTSPSEPAGISLPTLAWPVYLIGRGYTRLDQSRLDSWAGRATSRVMSSSTGSAAREVLAAVRLQDWPGRTGVVHELDASQTLQQALALLLTENLHSAPVYSPDEGAYLGFIDVLDAAAVAVDDWKAEAGASGAHTKRLMGKLLPHFTAAKSVQRAVGRVEHDPFIAANDDTTMLDIADLLLTEGTHRVAVLSPESGRVACIVSQSDIVRLLASHTAEIAQQLSRSVTDAGLAHKQVETVRATDPALKAFEKMVQEKITTVGIVDANSPSSGALLTALGASDIRAIARLDSFSLLSMPAMDFASHIRQLPNTARSHGYKDYPAVVAVSPETTLLECLSKLAATRLHQLFVVEKDTRALAGVVTAGDVLRAALRPQK